MNPNVHDLCLSIFQLDNLWGDYGPAGSVIEKKNQPSVPVPDNDNDINMPFVFNDITTYFTLLVGIYFPSVTGKRYKRPERFANIKG